MSIEEHLWPGEQIVVSADPFHATTQRLIRFQVIKRRECIESMEYGEIGAVTRRLRIRKQTVLLGVVVAILALTLGPSGPLKLLFAVTGLFGVLVGLFNRFQLVEFEGWDYAQMTRVHWRFWGNSIKKAAELSDIVDAAVAAGPVRLKVGPIQPKLIPLRSVLILPADRPDQLQPALALNPDAICLDLGETVAESKRILAQQFIWGEVVATSKTSIRALVRISNSAAIEELEMSIWAGLCGIIVPFKNVEEVYHLENKLMDLERIRGLPPTTKLVPYLENTGVLETSRIIESSSRIDAVILGFQDLATASRDSIGGLSSVAPADLKHIGVQCLGLLGTSIATERVREDVKTFENLLLHAAQQANLQGFVGALTPHPQGVVAATNGFEGSQFVYERDE